MITTEFKKGILSVLCAKAEPTLVIVEVDGQIWKAAFESGFGVKKARIFWEPKEIKAVGIEYKPIEKADKKPLKQGEHRTPPKGYPKKQSEYAGPHYDFPIDTEAHVRAALAYFNKHKWGPGEKGPAARKILRAAHKHNIKVSPDDAVSRAAHGRK